MKTLRILVTKHLNKQTKVEFFKASCKGKFIPLVRGIDNDTYYNIKFVGQDLPKKEGLYEVGCEDKDMWLDTRDEYIDKHIVRIKPTKYVYVGEKPTSKKD